MHKNEYLLKVMVLGHSTKLKEQLMEKFTSISMENDPYFSGFDIITYTISFDNNNVKLILVITNEDSLFDYSTSRPSGYRGASAGVVFFDKEDRETFNVVPLMSN